MGELLLGFAGGVIAWVVSAFLGQPLLVLLSARRDVQKGLYFYANVIRDDPDRLREAIIYFRQIGAEFEGLKCSLLAPIFYMIGFRLSAAVTALTGLSNSLDTVGDARIRARINARRALMLPKDQSDLDVLEMLIQKNSGNGA